MGTVHKSGHGPISLPGAQHGGSARRMAGEAGSSTAVSFGPFQLSPRQRVLLEAGKPVRVGSRALDLLIALLERPGELLSKDELISRVWPTTHVAEGNLKFQIANLRRALRDGQEGRRYLESSSGQGYRFVGDVTVVNDTAPSQPPSTPRVVKNNLPARLTPLIGRDDLVTKLAGRLSAQRLITVVGPGGIGKTSVAIATAEQLIGAYEDGVWSVDLGRLADPAFVRSTVAAAVRISMNPEDPLETLAAALRNARLLLVLDNCSHVIDAVAGLVVAILRTAPGVHILATSREPLRVEGEHIYRLGPLECPPASERLTAAEALRFPAVQLFVDLAAASHSGFELRDEDAPLIGEICRRLDGIPLAIELAAARVGVLGVHGLAARLENVLQVLTGGHRMALPRHRTMRAALDWSYSLLTPPEQMVFSRLAVFAGGFTLDAAAAVASDDTHSQEQIIDLVLELATKSLVAVEGHDAGMRFRLLDTTRAYALEKLVASGERQMLFRSHAEYYRALFEQAETGWQSEPTQDWLDGYSAHIDNLRLALDWAFSGDGEAATAVALTVAAVPLWIHLSLTEECRNYVHRALTVLDAQAGGDLRTEMKLRAAMGSCLLYTHGDIPEIETTWQRALELAESLNDTEYQLRSLWGLWSFHMPGGERRIALNLASRFCALAARRPDGVDRLIGEQMIGMSEHYLGDQTAARRHLERVCTDFVAPVRNLNIGRYQIDLRVMAQVFLARVAWLQGYPEKAIRTAESSIVDARAVSHATSLCYALALAACPVTLLSSDLGLADHYVEILLDVSNTPELSRWHSFGRCFQGLLIIDRGDAASGLQLIRAGFAELGRARSGLLSLIKLFLADALTRAGRLSEGLAAFDEAFEPCKQTEERWRMPELLRIKGELSLMQDESTGQAEDCFQQALDWARRQGALSWELRAATSLAQLLRRRGRTGEALALLQPVYDRFKEGFGMPDLKAAKALLDALA